MWAAVVIEVRYHARPPAESVVATDPPRKGADTPVGGSKAPDAKTGSPWTSYVKRSIISGHCAPSASTKKLPRHPRLRSTARELRSRTGRSRYLLLKCRHIAS